MPSFLTEEQKSLADEIAEMLNARGETVAVAEATTGGLISAALLRIAGASRFYAGGGVLYNINSRIVMAGVDKSLFDNYQGTTPEIIAAVAEGTRERLGATWCIGESGIAGPTGGRSGTKPGRTVIAVTGPVSRREVVETGLDEREDNMIEFTTRSLQLLRDVLVEAGK